MNKVLNLFGININQVDLAGATNLIIDACKKRSKGFVITPNVNMVTLLPLNPGLREIFMKASYSFVDGWPIVWGSKILYKRGLPERVAGSDLFPKLCERASHEGISLMLMGAAPGVAEEAARRLQITYPTLKIVGTYTPPMEVEISNATTNKMIDICNQLKPDLLLLGMGIPKQEIWISENIDKLDIGQALCFGGVIDFAAGRIKRAPDLVAKSGFEWLWRLCIKPSQYWKRTILRFPLFFPMLFFEFISNRLMVKKR